MKLKSTLFVLFFFYSILANSQSKQFVTAWFDYNSNSLENYICGGRTITGQITVNYSNGQENFEHFYRKDTIFAEDNKFFLEIAKYDSENFVRVLAQNIDIGQPGKAVFVFPDSIKNGDQLKIRMISTNPFLQSDLQNITFGVGAYPFIVDFSQEVNVYKDAPQAKLLVKSKLKNLEHHLTNVIYQNFTIKLSDGSVYNNKFLSSYTPAEITVLPKDSISIYKVTEVINSCGVKGEITGEAVVRKYDYIQEIVISSTFENINNPCNGVPFSINVKSKSLTPKTKLKVSISGNNFFEIKEIALDDKGNFVLELPPNLKDYTNLNVLIMSDNPYLISNTLSLLISPKVNSIHPFITTFDSKEISFYFNQTNNITGNTSVSYIEELVVNGSDFAKTGYYQNGLFKVPFPKKDSLVKFEKISTACGSLDIIKPEYLIKPNELQFFEFKSNVETACQGETVTIKYNYTNKTKSNRTNFEFFLKAYGNEYSPITKTYSGNNENRIISKLQYSLDTISKTIKVKIPDDLDKQIHLMFGNRRVDIEDIKIQVFMNNFEDELNTRVYFYSPKIKFNPRVALISQNITTDGLSITPLPLVFSGTNEIEYELSNGDKGTLNKTIGYCFTCLTHQYLNAEESINVLVDKNEVFKIKSIKTDCINPQISGSTNVEFRDSNTKKIIIKVVNLSKIACKDTTIKIPFEILGNWDTSTKFKAFVNIENYYGPNYNEEYELTNKYFIYKIPNSTTIKKIKINIGTIDKSILSNDYTINIQEKPNNIQYYTDYNSKRIENGVEINYVPENSRLTFGGNGSNYIFVLNDKPFKSHSQNERTSNLYNFIVFDKDTTIVFKSVSNYCGSVEVNKTIRLTKINSVIYNNGEINSKYFQPNSECSGSQHIIRYIRFGYLLKEPSLVVQLAKNNTNTQFSNLNFFDVPTSQNVANELTFTVPDSCFGNYVYRIKNLLGTDVSNYLPFSYSIKQKPFVRLKTASGKTEVVGSPGAKIFLDTDFDKIDKLNIILSNGEFLNFYDFGIISYTEYIDSTKNYQKSILNYGKYFTPNQTTTYSIKSAFNECGNVNTTGEIKIIVNPTIVANIKNSTLSNTFCANDSLLLELKYIGNFPKDTLMGIYLHTNSKSTYNQELTTFKNTPSSINIRLPKDIYSGYYFIQIRKKSRSKNYFTGNVNPDSLSLVNARMNWDSEPTYLRIATPPNVNLSGNPEIYAGNSVALNVQPINNNGQNIAISKDSIYLISGMTYYYEFTDGSKFSSIEGRPKVAPIKTTTYSISNIKNYCGIGTSSGNSTVTVLNKSDKRIEALGFYRKYITSPPQSMTIYDYEYTNTFCSGKNDSLDIKLFTTDKNIDVNTYKVLLSDKDGLNFTTISTTKSKIVTDSTNYKIIRLSFQLPDNLTFGFNYQIKGAAEDPNIPSAALTTPIKIYELPTATLTGNSQFIVGEKVNTLVKLTGDAPWSISVVDKDGKFAYNGLPTKADSSENFKNYQPKLIYDKELKLELNPEKSTSYKVSKVTNKTCGLGKVIAGEFTVDLILANENPVQNFIQIYPNPTADQLNIDLTSLNTTTVVETYNSMGKLLDSRTYIQSQTQHKQSLDFSQYHSGVYFIKVNTYKFSQTYRIVKH